LRVFTSDVFLSKLNVIIALLSHSFLNIIFGSNERCRIYPIYPFLIYATKEFNDYIISPCERFSLFFWLEFHFYNTDPIAQWMCKLSHPTRQTLQQQNQLIYLPSLIFKKIETYLNHIERSLSEVGRDRSQLQGGWIKLPLVDLFSLITSRKFIER
jgi:hypothetical protein